VKITAKKNISSRTNKARVRSLNCLSHSDDVKNIIKLVGTEKALRRSLMVVYKKLWKQTKATDVKI
jgi:hypothetical protein